MHDYGSSLYRIESTKSEGSHRFCAWRFCPGSLNPADLPSCGISGIELAHETLWFKGPEFLLRDEDEWPIRQVNDRTETGEALNEVVKQPTNVVRSLVTASEFNCPGLNLSKIIETDRFSSLRKFLRTTAKLLQFVNALKTSKRKEQSTNSTLEPLTVLEIEQAEMLLIRSIQRLSFTKEMRFLSSRGSQLSVPTYVKQFGLFLDDGRALRCQGRLNNSSLDLGSRNPILLPSRERFVELFIREVHERVKHNGIRDTLTTILKRFWIIRELVR